MWNKLRDAMLKLLFSILSVGPIPDHVAFIMDGNRRYAKKYNLTKQGMGHKLGFLALISILEHCYQLGIRHITIFAFSIDNFKRSPEEINSLKELLHEAVEIMLKEDSVVNRFGVRVSFSGDLSLLDEPSRALITKLAKATSGRSGLGLSVCIAYTSTDEITRAVDAACREEKGVIGLVDFESRLDSAVGPDPDIIIRTSGETRLSNFLLWQSARSLLCSPKEEWPEIGVWRLFLTLLNYQRMHSYFVNKNKLL